MSNTARLDEAAMGEDPLLVFKAWRDAARELPEPQPDAMALATVDGQGAPAVRFVLCRGVDDRGISFFTNLDSPKAEHLAQSPKAALAFYWDGAHRQVRITGAVESLTRAESAVYYATRAYRSQISAWASPQSTVVPDRQTLDARWREQDELWRDRPVVDVPPFWGGFRVLWESVEFWQGHPDRLHDRILFRRQGDAWRRERLAP